MHLSLARRHETRTLRPSSVTSGNDKNFLLACVSEERLRELAARWRVAIEDRRLRGPGIAKLIARKRSVSIADILAALSDDEASAALERLEVPSESANPRATLARHLTGSSWRRVRKAHADFTLTPDSLLAEIVDVIDGDTLRVRIEGKLELVRIRGVDAPESRPSPKAERDVDRAGHGHDDATEFALGERATARLTEILASDSAIELEVERRADGSLVKLHGHRLLAFVRSPASPRPDVGLAMIETGHALVWPRNTKSRRYDHPRVSEYLRACNAAFHARPGLWNDGLANHCPAAQSGATRCDVADCVRSCAPAPLPEDAT